ncbi:nucleobase:cation symporter-2 family protein [Desulfosporosinus sp. BICA1-9]|uniref:nucleobase:cation symporter-2 family protein n=1 Tax=Desulfosporosinus sp. BICA1-9 TaxID=1531958 RepID=UPI00054BA881|nr:nucleobase:cation symporter-2 family protein [Desulfosporosinus sp. BICA1-9]KJS88067.1 MAG: uracil permease [Desulfosporosinus sp. BICA1-9]HBW38961.1 purine permease [Desulfosporosinus sp.]
MANTKHGVAPVDEMLPAGKLFLYGLQHVLAMYAGAVAVPLIIAGAAGLTQAQTAFLINADLFTCGIATLLQTLGIWKIGIKIPVIQGVTFAAVTPMVIMAKSGGMTLIFGSVIVAGLFTFLVAPYFSKLIRFFPPIVTGTIITIIGVSLLPVGINWAAGGVGNKNYGSLTFILVATIVLVAILLINKLFKGFVSHIAVLLGLLVGLVVAIPLGLVNFSGVATAPWIGITTPFFFGVPKFEIGSIIAMILVMLVVMVESTGDFLAIGEMVGKKIGEEELTAGLRADGLATALGGIFNAFPYTAFAQNVGLVGLTGVKSRFVVATSGVILVILGLFPKMATIIASLPTPVLGGAGIAMFGIVAASGIKTLAKVDFEKNVNNIFIVAISIGIGVIPVVTPNFFQHFPSWSQTIMHSGITLGSITAIVLNAFFNGSKGAGDLDELKAHAGIRE